VEAMIRAGQIRNTGRSFKKRKGDNSIPNFLVVTIIQVMQSDFHVAAVPEICVNKYEGELIVTSFTFLCYFVYFFKITTHTILTPAVINILKTHIAQDMTPHDHFH